MRTKHPTTGPQGRRWSIKIFLGLVLLFVLVPQAWSINLAQSSEHKTEWPDLPPHIQAKVDPRILAELAGEIIPTHLEQYTETALPPEKRPPVFDTRFLVYLKAQTDFEALPIQLQATSNERRVTVVDALLDTARATQSPVKAVLDQQKARGAVSGYMPFYVFNGFAVQGNLDTVIELAQRDDVARLVANYRLIHVGQDTGPADPPAKAMDASQQSIDAANRNIGLVGADRVWDQLGITGQGAVVASFDTGVDWDHPALRDQYRGTVSGGPPDHNYNWFEFNSSAPEYWDTNGNYGPSASVAPYDCSSHGTHTTGTIVGDGGTQGTQIGMAPGAEWIAVPGLCGQTMPIGYEDDIGGLRTFQWLMCPTDLSGDLATRDCSKAPDVINNSWGSSNPADNTFQPIIQALRAAGIAPVFASGNPASGLGSIASPASIPEAIAVGATDLNDQIAPYSGLGPSVYEGVQKPELTAPGTNVLSSIPGTRYNTKTGTSMAAPHVAGLIALLISADLQDGTRDLDVDELLTAMTQTAVDLGSTGPDNEYGYGRINAFEAVNWILNAGTIQITVRDTNTQAPIENATVTLSPTAGSSGYTAQTDASGVYAFEVPAGTYDLRVEAFGYKVDIVSNVRVNQGLRTTVNTNLIPLSAGTLSGQVSSNGTPVPGARIYVEQNPGRETFSGANGSYSLRLPVGTHNLTIISPGYRIAHATVDMRGGTQQQNFGLEQAPTILLVEADGYKGWYEGRPARQFFQWSLDDRDYVYDTAVITDTAILPQLGNYDLVIWSHTIDSPGIGGYGTNGVLQDYLDHGGRLILSGQNIGYWDQSWGQDDAFYREYLHSAFYDDDAAQEKDTVSGSHFLQGIHLPLNEAALYGYPNTVTTLSPDSVGPLDGHAYPILTYDNGNGAAALAVDPCDSPYRVIYLSVGYENLGPRAASRPPEYAELLDRAIQWVIESKPPHDVSLALTPAQNSGTPGATLRYGLTVANTGLVADTYDLSLSGYQWPTRLLNGLAQVVSTAEIAPCDSVDLVIEVSIPALVNPDTQDTFILEAVSRSEPSVSTRVEGKTTALPTWQTLEPMPTPRYRLAAVSLRNSSHYYAIGGFAASEAAWDKPMDTNERYDTCSGQWQEMAPMPTPRGGIAAAAIGSQIYVAGGYANESWLDIVQVYDVPSNSWHSGASLPEPLAGAAIAAWNDRLYVFGGSQTGGTISNKTYVYDPTTDQWTEASPLPGGGRTRAAAATLNDKIYVVGGLHVGTVQVYDPAADAWSQAAPLNFARQMFGMAAAPDGRLYVAGGGDDWETGFRITERYDPQKDRWQLLDSLADDRRIGTAVVYADGRIFCTGGIGERLSQVHESMRLAHSFCHSTKKLATESGRLVQPGNEITYTIELHSGMTDLEGASVVDPIPEGTTFVGFDANPVGAVYDAAHNQVEWHGNLDANALAQAFSYVVDVNQTGWAHGAQIVNQASFDSGSGHLFTRVVTTSVDFPDPDPSTKSVSHDLARPGETLTYTLHIENSSLISDVFTLVDPLPPQTTYLPGSLSYSTGQGRYDPGLNQITWSGVLPIVEGQIITDYQWGDSAGNGTVPGVTFNWQNMSNATNTDIDADDGVYGPFTIGFTFGFYGSEYQEFFVSPNGWIGFDQATESNIVHCSDYGGDSRPNNFIGGFGGDRAVYSQEDGSITYKLIGTKPNRILVVQFTRMRYFYNIASNLADMQILLHEGSNKILIQYQNLTSSPTASYTGIEGTGPDYPSILYQGSCPAIVQNDLAILYEPILIPHYQHATELSFSVTADESIANYTWLTNTATLSNSQTAVQRAASTLINPVDLGTSTKTADKVFAVPGQLVTYTLLLNNTGRLPAEGATLVDPIPPHTVYEPHSVSCSSGVCDYAEQENQIRWSGKIPDGAQVALSFAVALSPVDNDALPIINEATLREMTGQEHSLQAVFVARTSDLSNSSKKTAPERVGYGEVLTYTIQVQNTGPVDTTAVMRDRLPTELTYIPGSLSCATGSCSFTDGTISWQGSVPGQTSIPVRFQVQAPDNNYPGTWLVNTAVITDTDRDRAYTLVSHTRLGNTPNERTLYLPLVSRGP